MKSDETLEAFRFQLEKASGRPAFITAGCMSISDRRYRKNIHGPYLKIDPFDLLLSSLWDQGKCVHRDTVIQEDRSKDLYYYDLVESPTVMIAIPYLEGDYSSDKANQIKNWFKTIGISRGINNTLQIIHKYENIPIQFQSYYTSWTIRSSIPKASGIRFHTSVPIEVPNFQANKWYINTTFHIKSEILSILLPPGQYNGLPRIVQDELNHYIITECDAGPCIVCRGESKEQIHLAVKDYDSRANIYATGKICRACTKNTFNAWQTLLDDKALSTKQLLI